MRNILFIFHILISLGLGASILLQAKGTGLGTAFGGAGEQFRSKRGVEKLLYRLTILLASLFLVTSILSLLV